MLKMQGVSVVLDNFSCKHFQLRCSCAPPVPLRLALFVKVTLWRAAHLCGQLPVLFTNETSSNIVDTFVLCEANM
jgi:hypothetical protein